MALNINAVTAGNFYGKNGIGKNKAVQDGANVGESVASIFKQGRSEDLQNATIQYATKENGKVSIDGALAYSRTSMVGLDKNGDGIIDAKDGIDPSLLRMIDANGDGKIDAAENAAYTMFADTLGGNAPDGILTPDEANKAVLPQRMRMQAQKEKELAMLLPKEKAAGLNEKAAQFEKQADELEKQYHDKIAGFVKGMNLEARDKSLVMPTKGKTPGNLKDLGLDQPAQNSPVQSSNPNDIVAQLGQWLETTKNVNGQSPFTFSNTQSNDNLISSTPYNLFSDGANAQQTAPSSQLNQKSLNILQQLVKLLSGNQQTA
ncbi:MAG: hypothetical protein WCK67_09290 [bacterium]